MPVTEVPQHMAALRRANEVRLEAARQRRELIGAPLRVLAPALIHPTPELARYRLELLFAPKGTHRGLILRVNRISLQRALGWLEATYPLGRSGWHVDLRLSELTENERRRLVLALRREAPRAWSEAA